MGRSLEEEKKQETKEQEHERPTDLGGFSPLFDASHFIRAQSESLQAHLELAADAALIPAVVLGSIFFVVVVVFFCFWNESVNPK